MEQNILGELPLELILEISDHLPAHSVASLSLTCKGFYTNAVLHRVWARGLSRPEEDPSHLPIKSLAILRPDVKNHGILFLLKLLQKDLPGLSLCDLCQKLHPHREVPITMNRESCPSWTPCSRHPSAGMWLHYDDWDVHLSSEHIQQFVRNYHESSKSHTSTSGIHIDSKWELHKYSDRATWMMKLEIKFLVVGGRLILHVCQRLMVTEDDIQSLGIHSIGSLASRSFKVCQCHVDMSDTIYVEFMKQRCRLSQGYLQCCHVCFTRVAFNIHPRTMLYPASSSESARYEHNLELSLDTWTMLSVNVQSTFDTYDEVWLLAASHSKTLYTPQRMALALQNSTSAKEDPYERLRFFASASASGLPSCLNLLAERVAMKQRTALDLQADDRRQHDAITCGKGVVTKQPTTWRIALSTLRQIFRIFCFPLRCFRNKNIRTTFTKEQTEWNPFESWVYHHWRQEPIDGVILQ